MWLLSAVSYTFKNCLKNPQTQISLRAPHLYRVILHCQESYSANGRAALNQLSPSGLSPAAPTPKCQHSPVRATAATAACVVFQKGHKLLFLGSPQVPYQGVWDPLDFQGGKGRLTTHSCPLQLHDHADQPAPGNLILQELTHVTLPFPAACQLCTRNESLSYLKFKIMSSHSPMKTHPKKSRAHNRILETVNTTSASSHSFSPPPESRLKHCIQEIRSQRHI